MSYRRSIVRIHHSLARIAMRFQNSCSQTIQASPRLLTNPFSKSARNSISSTFEATKRPPPEVPPRSDPDRTKHLTGNLKTPKMPTRMPPPPPQSWNRNQLRHQPSSSSLRPLQAPVAIRGKLKPRPRWMMPLPWSVKLRRASHRRSHVWIGLESRVAGLPRRLMICGRPGCQGIVI